ncbi:hypothetical protein [Mesorhizobium sp. CAU 1732]|uniref:hypothetical protein n=1 Tax=Mesorhizobium sp. CAU 1732 TaxID=3140358 RepID=UPI0032600B85
MIAKALAEHGLIARGGFRFADGDTPPAGPSGQPAQSVVLVGSAGAAYWTHFTDWRSRQPVDPGDPLDSWSRQVIGAVALQAGARLVMPNDRPYAPFQQWAMRAEGLRPSPLGILMHPDYGLWHAYRGALLFDDDVEDFDSPPAPKQNHPCDACVDKPCMTACPVDAHGERGFAYEACLGHVRSALGEPCRATGCLDRNACPVGTAYRYPAEIQAFHQRAFAGA